MGRTESTARRHCVTPSTKETGALASWTSSGESGASSHAHSSLAASPRGGVGVEEVRTGALAHAGQPHASPSRGIKTTLALSVDPEVRIR